MVLDMAIDIMGAQPALFKLYTQLAFVFAHRDPLSQPSITSALARALDRLSQCFPWVAGQVVDIRPDATTLPPYRIVPFEHTPRLFVKDYTHNVSVPSFKEMDQAGFPMSMLGEDRWAPCSTLASSGSNSAAQYKSAQEPAPVMLVQLSFIRGGLVLCINMQHNVCDMMGQAAVMHWLSKACCEEAFSEDELRIGNMDRSELIKLSNEEDWRLAEELEDQLIVPEPAVVSDDVPMQHAGNSIDLPAPAHCSWVYFNFSALSLETLKQAAGSELPDNFTGYISTDDALSAFIFQSILRARRSRISLDRSVTFARAVDARRYLGIEPAYPGILQNMAYTHITLSDLLHLPLGHIAAIMRQEIDVETSDVAHRTISLLTYLHRNPANVHNVSFTAKIRADVDIMLSSWTKVPAYDWTFGLDLGKPRTVRRPAFASVESLMYLMPKDKQNAVAVAMCLQDEDLHILRNDTEWSQHVTYLG